MYITPPIQMPLDHGTRTKPETPFNLTFKGLPKYEPDVFDLRPDFNRSQQNAAMSKVLQSAGLRTIDFWA